LGRRMEKGRFRDQSKWKSGFAGEELPLEQIGGPSNRDTGQSVGKTQGHLREKLCQRRGKSADVQWPGRGGTKGGANGKSQGKWVNSTNRARGFWQRGRERGGEQTTKKNNWVTTVGTGLESHTHGSWGSSNEAVTGNEKKGRCRWYGVFSKCPQKESKEGQGTNPGYGHKRKKDQCKMGL